MRHWSDPPATTHPKLRHKKSPVAYDQSRADYEFLVQHRELDDQQALDSERENLMRSPTKAFAAYVYHMGVRLWFDEHSGPPGDAKFWLIANRHGIHYEGHRS